MEIGLGLDASLGLSFDDEAGLARTAALDGMRERGAPRDELLDAFPDDLLRQVGYYGPAAGAAEAFAQLSEGLDVAIVRVVAARAGIDSVTAVMEACRPSPAS